MDKYNVKQIAEMLNTQPETVRRWIRNGKLKAEKASRKDGNVIKQGDLVKFLSSSPKYALRTTGLIRASLAVPTAIMSPLVGVAAATMALATGSVATKYLKAIKTKKMDDMDVSKEDIIICLKKEIEQDNKDVIEISKTLEELQAKLDKKKQEIIECTFVLEQIESEEEIND